MSQFLKIRDTPIKCLKDVKVHVNVSLNSSTQEPNFESSLMHWESKHYSDIQIV